MSFNTFGKLFRFTTWGESHGPAIGCIIDGCPPLITVGLPHACITVTLSMCKRCLCCLAYQ